MILSTFAGDAHDVAIYLVCGIAMVLLLGMARFVVKAGRAITKLLRYVIPHFEPPTETEIREGIEDNTLPNRMKSMEERLARHLDDEEKAAEALYRRIDAIERSTRPKR